MDKQPIWKYIDRQNRLHIGYLVHVSDFGGTDITYHFRDSVTGELTLVSGSLLKKANRIWTIDTP